MKAIGKYFFYIHAQASTFVSHETCVFYYYLQYFVVYYCNPYEKIGLVINEFKKGDEFLLSEIVRSSTIKMANTIKFLFIQVIKTLFKIHSTIS